jgi:predicted phage terminase large subunit-like protein
MHPWPKLNRYIPHVPTVHQGAFLCLPHQEALYGGAAGGGKSDALLMGALQYVDVPGYAAIILRRTFSDLALPGALMDRAEEWLTGTGAKWLERSKTWRFPSGATLSFGYLEAERDKYRYQGSEFQYLAFDELTQFSESQYRYLLSRLRRRTGVEVPLRARAASNPGGIGHEWVRRRFLIEGEAEGRAFIPARLADNPHLDADEYRRALAELDPVTRRQLLEGDWSARSSLGFFRREWFKIEERAPEGLRWVRFWDTASKAKTRSDFWAGVKAAMLNRDGRRELWIANIVHGKWEYADGKAVVLQTARADGRGVAVGIEDAASGTALLSDLRRAPEAGGTTFAPVVVTTDKVTRAGPWASLAQGEGVYLLSGSWVGPFLDECDGFPQPGVPDDRIDAVSGAYEMLLTRLSTSADDWWRAYVANLPPLEDPGPIFRMPRGGW